MRADFARATSHHYELGLGSGRRRGRDYVRLQVRALAAKSVEVVADGGHIRHEGNSGCCSRRSLAGQLVLEHLVHVRAYAIHLHGR